MLEPDEVSAMLRLKELGWGTRRIARELGVSRNTVKNYIEAGGWMPYQQPARKKRLDGEEAWLKERFSRHRGNADVIRQELAAEKEILVSLRTIERAVQPYRQELAAELRATVRFETAPGKQLQIDFGERLVEIGGAKVKAFLFVATLGYSRRLREGVPQRATGELVCGSGECLCQVLRGDRGGPVRQRSRLGG